MRHPGRTIAVLAVLVLVCGLNAGCSDVVTASPEARPTQVALQPTRETATTTYTAVPTPQVVQVVPSADSPRPHPTQTPIPTPIPTTLTPTYTVTPLSPTPTDTATITPTPTLTPSPSATPRPATATRTPVPPTATSQPSRFLPSGPAQPDPSHPCPGCPRAPAYIVGRVVDPAGNPLAGVRLVCYNEWHRYPVVASKGSGEYDFAVIQAQTTWYVVVLDQADQPISPEVAVPFDPQETCRYILDWRRTD